MIFRIFRRSAGAPAPRVGAWSTLILVGLLGVLAGPAWGQALPGQRTRGPSLLSGAASSEPVARDVHALRKIAREAAGDIAIPAGRYILTETWEIDLSKTGAVTVQGLGPVTLVMAGPGPALRIRGHIRGTADPGQFTEEDWRQRMPQIEGLEIVGEHPEADGIELSRTMQASLRGVSVRRTRHAIRLVERNRNVIISDCHLYDNRGVGLFLDHVNLHQINVANSHISYNRQGGIVVRGGNVRNLQITGCDIEANMPDDGTSTKTANVWIDQSMKDCSAAEIAITGCTIQHSAHYGSTPRAPGGANIRVIGNRDFQPNMITISGNVLSDTETHLHLRHVTDVTVTGNTFFTTEPTDLLVEHSQRVVVGSCVFNPRESKQTGQVVLRDSQQCMLVGLVLHRLQAGRGAVQLERCRDCRVQACVVSESRNGVVIVDSDNCQVEGLTTSDLLEGGRGVLRE